MCFIACMCNACIVCNHTHNECECKNIFCIVVFTFLSHLCTDIFTFVSYNKYMNVLCVLVRIVDNLTNHYSLLPWQQRKLRRLQRKPRRAPRKQLRRLHVVAAKLFNYPLAKIPPSWRGFRILIRGILHTCIYPIHTSI